MSFIWTQPLLIKNQILFGQQLLLTKIQYSLELNHF